MIGKLRGMVDSVTEDGLLLDVGGVGYQVFASATTLRNLGDVGAAAVLWIETHIREDHFHLYGFATESERSLFRILTTVQGVGAKVALAILSALTPEQIHTALASQDVAAFTRASGVGKKLAERIVTELKGKAGSILADVPALSAHTGAVKVPATGTSAVLQDAVSALTNLGYARSDAFLAVGKVLQQSPDTTVADAIRLSLRDLSGAAA